MGKALVVGVFSLAFCWGVQKFVNLETVAGHVAGVPISWTMIVFAGGVGLCMGLMGKR